MKQYSVVELTREWHNPDRVALRLNDSESLITVFVVRKLLNCFKEFSDDLIVPRRPLRE